MSGGTNGLSRIRRTSSRTLSSTSENGRKSMCEASLPVSAASFPRRSSLLKVSIPQSVWWMTAYSCVPRRRLEMMSERSASSDARPPAFRITCASPISMPRNDSGWSRASMQVSTTNRSAGGIGASPLSKSLANFSFLFLNRSMMDMRFSFHRTM
jgi:hypothetical protein